jgi:hypothetical protein
MIYMSILFRIIPRTIWEGYRCTGNCSGIDAGRGTLRIIYTHMMTGHRFQIKDEEKEVDIYSLFDPKYCVNVVLQIECGHCEKLEAAKEGGQIKPRVD